MRSLAMTRLAASGLLLLFAPTLLAREGVAPRIVQGTRVDKTITWQTTFNDLALSKRPKGHMTVECPGNGMLSDIEGNDFGTGSYEFTAGSSVCSAAVWWSHGAASQRMTPRNGGIVTVQVSLVDIAPRHSRNPMTLAGVTLRDFSSRTDIYRVVSVRSGVGGLTGDWSLKFIYQGQAFTHGMKLAQSATSATGTGFYPERGQAQYAWTISSGSVSGDTVEFTANYTLGTKATMRVQGKIAPNGSMAGTWSDDYLGGKREGTWSAALSR